MPQLLAGDEWLEVLKFLPATDTLLRVRYIDRSIYEMIESSIQTPDSAMYELIEKSLREQLITTTQVSIVHTNHQTGRSDKYDTLIGGEFIGSVSLKRLCDEKEKKILDEIQSNTFSLKYCNISDCMNLILRFGYISMGLKPKQSTEFLMKIPIRNIIETIQDEEDNSCFKDICMALSNCELKTLSQDEVYYVHGYRYESSTVHIYGVRPCNKLANQPIIVDLDYLNIRSGHSRNYYEINELALPKHISLFLTILDQILRSSYEPVSILLLYNIAQQEFQFAGRKLILKMPSTFNYGLEDTSMFPKDIPCELHCDTFKREFYFPPSTIIDTLNNNKLQIGIFAAGSIYMVLMQMYTSIPSFYYTRTHFWRNGSPLNLAATALFGLADCVSALGLFCFVTQESLWGDGIVTQQMGLIAHTVRMILSCLYLGSIKQGLLYSNLSLFESSHNFALYGFGLAFGVHNFNMLKALVGVVSTSGPKWISNWKRIK